MDTTTFPTRVSKPQVRIGDAERQGAAAQLQTHYAQGRLTWEELDERLAAVWSARTNGDLTGLFDDLPAIPPPTPPQPTAWRRRVHLDLRVVLLVSVAIFLVVATRGFILVPLVWWAFLGGRRRQFVRRHRGGYDHSHHGNAWS